MLKCRDIVNNSDLLTTNLPWQKKLSIWMHLIICHNCRRYLRQLKVLIQALPFMHKKASAEEINKIMATIQANT